MYRNMCLPSPSLVSENLSARETVNSLHMSRHMPMVSNPGPMFAVVAGTRTVTDVRGVWSASTRRPSSADESGGWRGTLSVPLSLNSLEVMRCSCRWSPRYMLARKSSDSVRGIRDAGGKGAAAAAVAVTSGGDAAAVDAAAGTGPV